MQNKSKVALISGANKGIGLSVARGLGRLGITVLVGSRKRDPGEAAAAALTAEGLDAKFISLDVTDAKSLAACAKEIESAYGKLDILINNAGINLDQVPPLPPSKISIEAIRQTYETNVFGAIALIQVTLPLLRKAEGGRIVNVSSNQASLTQNSDPAHFTNNHLAIAYASSKTALNAVTVAFAKELRNTSIKINSAGPGLTRTELTASCAAGRDPEAAAQIIIRLATLGDDCPHGRYFNDMPGGEFNGYTNGLLSVPW